MTSDTIIAKAGEQVTCENGHPICTVAEPIVSHSIVRPGQFKDWTWDYDPKSHEQVAPCQICGKQFMGTVGGVSMLHVGDQWRGRGNYV